MLNTEISPINKLALFETTKAERESFAVALVEAIENGEVDALKVHLQIKNMESMIDMLTSTDQKKNPAFETAKKYKASILNASAQYSGKSFELYNAKFETRELGVKYDYTQCGSQDLLDLYKQQEAIKEQIKEKEKFLQTIPESGVIVTDPATGETYTVYRPSKTSTTSIVVTLK